MNKIDKLPPFKRFCITIGNLPSSYVDSMSYYECIMWLCKYLKDTVIPAVNENAEAVNELINWFNNLDVQDEINNKLDEMVESGQLQEIISEYLNSTAVFGFDTVDDMVNATNLIDGSFARTTGKLNYNDGNGAFYKIRTITNEDVVDGENIIAMTTSDTLVAEKIINNRLNNLEYDVSVLKGTGKKFILISDSYGTLTNTNTKTWCEEFKNNMGLSDSQVIIKAVGGARFDISQTATVTTFQELLEEVPDDSTVTDIIVCGGYNDQGVPYQTIYNSISAFKTYANTHFPNAKISIGFIGKTTIYDKIYNVAYGLTQYVRCCKELNINYLNNVQYTLNDTATCLSSDHIHPTDDGQVKLGYNIAQSYLYGTCTNYQQYMTFNLVENANFTLSATQYFYLTLNDGIAILGNRGQIGFNNLEGFDFGNGNSNVELATVSDSTSVIGNSYNTINIPVNYLLQNDGTFYTGMGVVTINNKSFKFRPLLCTTNNYRTLNKVTWIQLQPYHHVVDSTML